MIGLVSNTVLLGCALLAFYAVRLTRQRHRQQRKEAAYGCQPAPRYPHQSGLLGSLGIKHVAKLIRAKKEHRLPTAFSSIFTDTGPSVHTVAYDVLGTTKIWTIDTDNIKDVLSSNFKAWALPAARVSVFAACWSGGIFGLDGHEWERSRAKLRPCFARKQIEDLEMMETHVGNLIKRIPEDGQAVDLAELFPLFTMDIATDLLFGESAGALHETRSDQGLQFTVAFNYIMEKMSVHLSLPFLAWLPDTKLKNSITYINKYTDDVIDQAVRSRRERVPDRKAPGSLSEKSDKYILLDDLLEADDSPVRLRGELLSIMVAGRDTTASLLAILWWHLSRRPDIVGKLRSEIDGLGSRPPSLKELRSFNYLALVIKEVLRLYPINPINSRVALHDTILPRGGGKDRSAPVWVRKGQQVIFSSAALHRRTDIYGQDALQLNPERWNSVLPSTWSYIPFGGGPRVCLGQQLAITEASYATVRLLQEFSSIAPEDEEPFKEGFAMVLFSGSGCRLRLRRKW